VSKKKSAKKKSAAPSRRKATTSRSSSRRPGPAAPRPRKIQLKPIKVLVERALVDLRRLPPTEATDITIKHLEACSMALGDICDPQTAGGCGPIMEFLV
jgi:hypothetical protein